MSKQLEYTISISASCPKCRSACGYVVTWPIKDSKIGLEDLVECVSNNFTKVQDDKQLCDKCADEESAEVDDDG